MDLAGFGDQHAAVYSIVSYPFLSYLHSSQYTAGACGAGPEFSHSTAAGSCIKSIGWRYVVLENTIVAK